MQNTAQEKKISKRVLTDVLKSLMRLPSDSSKQNRFFCNSFSYITHFVRSNLTLDQQGEIKVKKIVVTSLLVLAVGVALALTGVAQNAATAPAPVRSSVAVVDVNKIMSEWKYVSARRTDLENQYKPKFEALKARADELQKQAQVLKTMKRGEPEYQNLENTLIRKEQDIKTDNGLLSKQFDEQAAKIFQDAYKYIKQHAAFYAKQIGATCVIQVNSADEFQSYNPRVSVSELTVQEVVARQVIWYDGAINVTDQILARLNSGAQQQSNTARTTTNR